MLAFVRLPRLTRCVRFASTLPSGSNGPSALQQIENESGRLLRVVEKRIAERKRAEREASMRISITQIIFLIMPKLKSLLKTQI
jgi:hypothetical protein